MRGTCTKGNSYNSDNVYSAALKIFIDRYRRAVQYIIKQACKEAGISTDVSPHSLRHYALSNLLSEDYDIFTIQVFAGYSQLATTARYLHKLNNENRYRAEFLRKNTLIGKLSLNIN